MGLFDFVKDAGAKIFGGKSTAEKKEEARAEKEAQIKDFVAEFKLDIADFSVSFSGDDDEIAILSGVAKSQEGKEKLILAVGNIEGIAQVDDRMTVEEPKPEAQFYTVARGDSLSKIAKKFYGNAMKYPVIFEANKPMLKDPNLIYPGQVLRIPPQEE
ncbi:MAG: peptidoglycan-binding protein LysM [Bacteroidetes bacterium]|nr:MAG: peptidoglycan-binding protein LysM [Bacteroidota bacterium]